MRLVDLGMQRVVCMSVARCCVCEEVVPYSGVFHGPSSPSLLDRAVGEESLAGWFSNRSWCKRPADQASFVFLLVILLGLLVVLSETPSQPVSAGNITYG